MQEILTVITYLVVWFESGFVTLIISLGAAVSVYVIFAVKQHANSKDDDDK